MKAATALAIALAACGQNAPASKVENATNAKPVEAPAAPPARPFSVEEKTDLYEFDYAWSAEAAAIPALVKQLTADMEKTKAELVAGAEEDRAMRKKEDFDFHPHSSSTGYETAGQSPRLLSLRVDAGGYTGGAHGNFGTGSLLWDRQAGREMDFADLFVAKANRDRLLTQRWCDSLNKQREENRGEPIGGGGIFDECPGLDDIAIIPTDSNKDGRFDRLMLIASPYVAGPYAEGSYEIELAITPDLVAALKKEFQPSFAPQGAQ